MRDPDTALFEKWQQLAATGEMFGRNRPVGRLTLSTTNRVRSVRSNRPGPWRYTLFQGGQHELGNVVSIDINRSLGDDAASCTIVLNNDYMPHYGYSPQGIDTGIGRPGYLTYNRGDTSPIKTKSVYNQFVTGEPGVTQQQGFEYDAEGNRLAGGDTGEPFPTEWGYPKAGTGNNDDKFYYDRIIPNRLIRTYQGYGSDNFDAEGNDISVHTAGYVPPESDTQLVCTGHWLIDSVQYNTNGTINIVCRDIGKVLLEQTVYPPLLPLSRFPLIYGPETPATGEHGGESQNLARGYSKSSNDPWYGKNALLYGHRPTDAFDGHPGSYWLSVGNQASNDGYSYEYIQTKVNNMDCNEVYVTTKFSGYVCFVSVMESGTWQGSSIVPYDPNNNASFPNGSNIPYVVRTTIGSEGRVKILLPRTYKAQQVRVCFTNLQDSHLGDNRMRAAVREFEVRYNKPNTYVASTVGKPGHISDWSEAIKELCGWGGLTWLTDHNVNNGSSQPTSIPADPLLGTSTGGEPLRVWGDFEKLGAGPILFTPADFFLNKSFMECINTIRDFLGCIFFIDESGGAVFRFPNVMSGGNFITDPGSTSKTVYMKKRWPIEFHESANLIDYNVQIDDSQVRSEVLVVGRYPSITSSAPLAAGVVLGTNTATGTTSAINFTNVLGGQYRLFMVPGSASFPFKTQEECQRMAELIGIKILQSYRKGTATVTGHPGLQVDDQVRIFERITNEYNVHYVSGISSRMNLTTGEYVMTVTTHWLGDDPDRDWFLNHLELTPAVKNLPAVIDRIGTYPPEAGPGGAGTNPGGAITGGDIASGSVPR